MRNFSGERIKTDDKLKKSLNDEELDNVAGGYKGDYSQIYRLLKNNGAVSGNPNNFKEISSDSEKSKVEDVLGNILGGSVEIGQFSEKENVYWVNDKAMNQQEVVDKIKSYYAKGDLVFK